MSAYICHTLCDHRQRKSESLLVWRRGSLDKMILFPLNQLKDWIIIMATFNSISAGPSSLWTNMMKLFINLPTWSLSPVSFFAFSWIWGDMLLQLAAPPAPDRLLVLYSFHALDSLKFSWVPPSLGSWAYWCLHGKTAEVLGAGKKVANGLCCSALSITCFPTEKVQLQRLSFLSCALTALCHSSCLPTEHSKPSWSGLESLLH